MSGPGATIFGCEGPRLTAVERAFFTKAQPWGFILFARNVENPEQLRRLTTDLRAAVGREVPVLIDQEGGRVQRMRPPHWRLWQPPLDQMRRAGSLETAARAMYLRYKLIAHELRAVGIDTNCAPLADVATAETHPFLYNRCFGEDVASVVTGARACAEGLVAGGVLPVIKHIPGHGRAQGDSHKQLPTVEAPVEELSARDFEPFRALADLPMGMTAHIDFKALDPGRPATQSPTVIALIRDEIGFDGLLMTDDLSMEALSGTVAERAAASRAAGCDLILHCNGEMDEMAAVAEAAGHLEGVSRTRAEKALAARSQAQEFDTAAVENELRELLDGEVYA